MSVVNQMLRDLDARQVQHDALPLDPPPARSTPQGRRRWMTVGAGVMVASVAAVVIARAPERSSVAAPAVTPLAQPAVVTVPHPVIAAPTQELTAQAPVVATAPVIAAAPQEKPATKPTTAPRPPAATGASTKAASGSTAPTEVRHAPPPERPVTNLAKAKPAAASDEPVRIEKRSTEAGAQSAAAAFGRAAELIEKGRIADAKVALNAALAADPDHAAARQTLAALLIEVRALDEAEATLTDGLARDPANSNFAIVLARLKLERGDQGAALELLARHRAAALSNAQYRAFHAALLRRAGRHGEAADEYQAALRLSPGVGVWWVGLALSHEANEREADSIQAFRQARATGTLTTDLAELVERKLRGSP